jgi:hypothetical protein
MDFYPRPSHADYTYLEKYGVKASSGKLPIFLIKKEAEDLLLEKRLEDVQQLLLLKSIYP